MKFGNVGVICCVQSVSGFIDPPEIIYNLLLLGATSPLCSIN